MFGKKLARLSALWLVAISGAAAAENLDATPQAGSITQGRPDTGGQSYGDRNRGGRSGFYSYPSHRHIDGGSSALAQRSFSPTDPGTSTPYRSTHGSAYYGRNYGAPYFGGGYYDDGVYYRERRD